MFLPSGLEIYPFSSSLSTCFLRTYLLIPKVLDIAITDAFDSAWRSLYIRVGVSVEKDIISPSNHHVFSLSTKTNSNIESMYSVNALNI